jgi:hypothetical protein
MKMLTFEFRTILYRKVGLIGLPLIYLKFISLKRSYQGGTTSMPYNKNRDHMKTPRPKWKGSSISVLVTEEMKNTLCWKSTC